MTFGALVQQAQARHLSVLGGFHPGPADSDLPKGCQTVLMLGPDEPRFWPAFQQSAEWRDGMADPMDRWSTRVIG
jgi:epoxyqueuosine reductase